MSEILGGIFSSYAGAWPLQNVNQSNSVDQNQRECKILQEEFQVAFSLSD